MKQPEKPEIEQHYVELLIRILRDTAISLGLRSTAFKKDEQSIRKRVHAEGMSFITKDLPQLGKALDKVLAQGNELVVPLCFKARRYGSTKIPIILGDLWKLIIRPDGEVKESDLDACDKRAVDRMRPVNTDSPCALQITAVRAVRQICYLGYKLEYPYDKEQVAEKISGFRQIDSELPEEDSFVELSLSTRQALESANLLISYVLRRLNVSKIRPKHGPGAVATGEKPWEKHNFSRFFPKLDKMYSYADYFFFNYGHLCDNLDRLEAMEVIPEAISKIVLVPKDSRGPRLISMEPLEIQWIQQGLAREIIEIIEDSRSITSGFVNFSNQQVNRDLALTSSNPELGSLSFVTLDMKDASDRVSLWLVKKLFPPYIYAAMHACRSGLALTPIGDCIALKKFASMGSALCFPVEALIFWALAVGSLVHVRTRKDLYNLPEVYVYGDDIIVRKYNDQAIRPVFDELNLKFNEDKCCTGDFFRESCGCDAFKGVDVTPIRLHTLWPSRWSPKALLSYVSYANNFISNGRHYSLTSLYIRDVIQEQLVRPLPIGMQGCTYPLAFTNHNETAGTLAYHNSNQRTRWNKRLQRREMFLPMVYPSTINRADELDWDHMWNVRSKGVDPFGFNIRCMESGTFTIPHIVKLRGTWVSTECLLA